MQARTHFVIPPAFPAQRPSGPIRGSLRLGRIALAMGSTASAASRQGQFMADERMEGGADDLRRQLRAFYHRLGLVPDEQWIPPGSFEERNRMGWLPGNIKRYMPRLPLGSRPMICGRGKE